MGRRFTALLTGLASLAAIASLLAGIPYLLLRFVGNPLPGSLPSLADLGLLLERGRVDTQVIVNLLAIVVWLAWAQLALGLTMELFAALQGRSAPSLPLIPPGMQRAAAQLIAGASLLLNTLGPVRPVLAADLGALATPAVAVATAEAPAGLTVVDLLGHGNPSAEIVDDVESDYLVRRGDSLWSIAERSLGDGSRWREIRDVNVGRTQPDGCRLTAGFVGLQPGWTLTVPAEAQATSATERGTSLGRLHLVVEGETLSGIAEDVYGDPDNYKAILDANRGRVQDDGGALVDPDVIRPGWHLHIPASDTTALAAPIDGDLGAEEQAHLVPDPDLAAAASSPTATAEPSRGEALAGAPTAEQPAAVALPATSPAPTLRSQPSPAQTAVARPADEVREPREPDVAAPAILGASALVAASLVLGLSRLRGRQARRRLPGRDLPQPVPELAAVERVLRRAATDQPLEWLDATLRLLTVRLGERSASAAPPPGLLVLRAGDFGVELLLDGRDDQPPAWFEQADGGHVWRLDPSVSLQDAQEAARDAAPSAPAIVTLGGTPEGPVLVNLEQLGLLRVQGPHEMVQAFLSGLTVELSTAPWSSAVTVHPIVQAEDPLAHLPGVRTGTLDELTPQLQAFSAANRAATSEHESTLAARTAEDGEDWPPVVVVIRDASAVPADQLAQLIDAAQSPRSGLAVVVGGEFAGATWSVQLSDDGSATLEPLGLSFAAAGMDEDTTSAAAGLLDLAVADDIARPTPLPERDAEPTEDVNVDPLPVEVTVLGPIRVSGWKADEVRPKAVEIVTYLAITDRPVSTDRLRTALWPDGVNYNSFKTSVSRTRHALGVDREGAFHLPEAKDSRYRLGPDVGCDWTRFQALAGAARPSAAQAVELLRKALELVKGHPFDGATGSAYRWAYDEQIVSAIEVAVVDAAHRLAELALDTRQPELAVWATQQGHLVVPDHEGLYRARMRAHAALNDLDAVLQAFREAQRAAQALDALDDVQPETEQLYTELSRSPRAARGA